MGSSSIPSRYLPHRGTSCLRTSCDSHRISETARSNERLGLPIKMVDRRFSTWLEGEASYGRHFVVIRAVPCLALQSAARLRRKPAPAVSRAGRLSWPAWMWCARGAKKQQEQEKQQAPDSAAPRFFGSGLRSDPRSALARLAAHRRCD